MDVVLFDMDGVLVESDPAHFDAWQGFARESGIVITAEMFHRAFSGRKNEEALESLFPGRFSDEEKRELSRRKEALYRERYVPQLRPVAGVQELVRDLQRHGVPLALATSGPPENVDAILRHLRLEDAFDAIVTGYDVPEAKPNPAIFLRAAQALGVRASGALVVEDSLAGVQAAVAAGATCLAVTTTELGERLRAAGAAHVVRDFQGLTTAHLAAIARPGAAPGPARLNAPPR